MALPPDWCSTIISPCVDLAKPGIYKWEIDGGGVYVGKYSRPRRPTQEYRRNVERILANALSHHKNGAFRPVHHALADAVRNGKAITLTIMANGEKEDLNRLERQFILSEKANLNGRASRLATVEFRRSSKSVDSRPENVTASARPCRPAPTHRPSA